MRWDRAEEAQMRWDRAVAAAVLLFAVYVVELARGMAYWQGRIPGPGFVPLWLGIALAVAAAGVLVGTWRAPRGAPPASGAGTRGTDTGTHDPGTGTSARDAAVPASPGSPEAAVAAPGRLTAVGLATVTVVTVALVERIGMASALVLLVVASVRLLGGAWRTALLAAVGLTAGLVLLFGRWLQVPLPRGPWGF
ncbi:MAG: tripartite tricarboxylate transporter TctB family protein [Armatimonadota bacterium]|nr:tripartite tricarboxylate transporter TctB family protein [Armatimonadota bacterium]MDR7534944.1 tripartite tricarboxylate transporter TctB family protein [Armatimonadota bacterium]